MKRPMCVWVCVVFELIILEGSGQSACVYNILLTYACIISIKILLCWNRTKPIWLYKSKKVLPNNHINDDRTTYIHICICKTNNWIKRHRALLNLCRSYIHIVRCTLLLFLSTVMKHCECSCGNIHAAVWYEYGMTLNFDSNSEGK